MSQTLAVPTDPATDEVAAGATTGGTGWWRRLLGDSAYNLGAGVVAIPAFVVAVVGVSVGAATLVIGVGLLVLVGTAFVLRGLAYLERLRMRTLLGRSADTPQRVEPSPRAGRVRRVLTPLRDPQTWLDLVWAVVGFATGLAVFVVTIAWWAGALGGITYWYWQQFLPLDDSSGTLASLLGFGDGRVPEIWLNSALGVAAVLLLPLVMRLLAGLHAGLSSTLLCSRAALQSELERSEIGRDAARRAEVGSLRRLERDIHDGPQQRLVRLQMDLGRARKQVGDPDADPAQLHALLDESIAQARATVEELRALSRGIAPPVLVDRGLDAALREAFARCPLAVAGEIDLGEDPVPPAAETTVYFVVSEALTNAAKHSQASGVGVVVRRDGDRLLARVSDDGVGGADVGKGHGLAGLVDRVQGSGGTLVVDSPPGGPTVVTAEVPCA